MARLNSEHLAELRQLHALGQAVLDELVSDLADIGPHLKNALNGAFELQDVRAMRIAVRDLVALLTTLPPARRREVVRAVEKDTGAALPGLEQSDAKAAAEILQRGRIRNDREYYLLRSHLDRLEASPARVSEGAAALRLLETYRVS
jgi:hypothetical protein